MGSSRVLLHSRPRARSWRSPRAWVAPGAAPRPAPRSWAKLTPAGRGALEDGTRLGPIQRAVITALAGVEGELAAGGLQAAGADLAALRRHGGAWDGGASDDAARAASRDRRVARPVEQAALNAAQSAALSSITGAIDRSEHAELLLHGVTGSGKTEVYLAAAEAVLARGRGTIVLVPEIALAPQTVSRFASRFGDGVALLHSRLSAGERRDEWHRLRSGEAMVCVGPRSAVFAPVRDLGLIVVDEEHDPSYKQEGDPRYDAREVAVRRAQSAGAVLVCGSATPRPESWDRLPRLELPERADGIALPEVDVLDMRTTPRVRAGPCTRRPSRPSARSAMSAGRRS